MVIALQYARNILKGINSTHNIPWGHALALLCSRCCVIPANKQLNYIFSDLQIKQSSQSVSSNNTIGWAVLEHTTHIKNELPGKMLMMQYHPQSNNQSNCTVLVDLDRKLRVWQTWVMTAHRTSWSHMWNNPSHVQMTAASVLNKSASAVLKRK